MADGTTNTALVYLRDRIHADRSKMRNAVEIYAEHSKHTHIRREGIQ